jgi:hypothetical protein
MERGLDKQQEDIQLASVQTTTYIYETLSGRIQKVSTRLRTNHCQMASALFFGGGSS